jgi:uncharacterized membrane protein YdjX (TVP38/TMEM64 family)
VLAFLVILLGLFGLHQLTHSYLSLDQIIEKDDWLRDVIQSNPATAIMLGFAIYCVTSLVPGASGKSILFGWLFGFWWATLIGNFGLTVAALSTFFVSRFFLRDFIERKFANQLAWLNRAISADGGYYLVILRLLHVPYTFLNYTCGASVMHARTFWWATQLGMLPGCMIFAYAGSRLPTLREFSDQGLISVLDPWLFTALLASGLIPIIARWIYRRFPVRLK